MSEEMDRALDVAQLTQTRHDYGTKEVERNTNKNTIRKAIAMTALLCDISQSRSTDRDIFPLCQDAVSEVGKPGYPGGLITRRAVSTFAKLQMAASSNQPLAITFFKQEICLFNAVSL
jgi:hypothetical protein